MGTIHLNKKSEKQEENLMNSVRYIYIYIYSVRLEK